MKAMTVLEKNNVFRGITMRPVFLMFLLSIVMLMTGCVNINSNIDQTPQELAKEKAIHARALQNACDSSDMLLANLTKPLNERTYAIKPGVICHD